MDKQANLKEIVSFHNVDLAFDGDSKLFSKLNLQIESGNFYFLTGISGAGKSTLLKMIYLACGQTGGHISVFGENTKNLSLNDVAYMRRQMGIVFQDFRLVSHLNVLDNVSLPLKIRGVSSKKSRKQAAELLAWVGLEDFLDHLPHTLSGGQQQRVAIARAVIARPKLLLADEPTGNVDDAAALRILYLFEEMHKAGTTVILATHNRSLAKQFNHSEIFLQKGKSYLIHPANQGGTNAV
ncbi:MAG: ATP-binding cassette domain-containing protein [Alphaproteobacteria bacterium]